MRRGTRLPPIVVVASRPAPREFFTITLRPNEAASSEWPTDPIMHCLLREFLEEVLENYSEQDTLRDYVRETRKDDEDRDEDEATATVSGEVVRAIMLAQEFKVFAAIMFVERRNSADVQIICSRKCTYERRLLNELKDMEKREGRIVFSLHQAVRYTNGAVVPKSPIYFLADVDEASVSSMSPSGSATSSIFQDGDSSDRGSGGWNSTSTPRAQNLLRAGPSLRGKPVGLSLLSSNPSSRDVSLSPNTTASPASPAADASFRRVPVSLLPRGQAADTSFRRAPVSLFPKRRVEDSSFRRVPGSLLPKVQATDTSSRGGPVSLLQKLQASDTTVRGRSFKNQVDMDQSFRGGSSSTDPRSPAAPQAAPSIPSGVLGKLRTKFGAFPSRK